MPNVGLIDYRVGNIQSLSNAIEHIGAHVHIVRTIADMAGVTHLILPGVGAFGFCADRLKSTGMLPALEEWAFAQCNPILGICVGMQLLADSSEELGMQEGLGWIGGRVCKLKFEPPNIRVPHVGWNTAIFNEDFGEFHKDEQVDFYFDHSYAYQIPTHGQVLAGCHHGDLFSAAIRRDNIVGAQFHPEKSQSSGMRFLRGFLAM